MKTNDNIAFGTLKFELDLYNTSAYKKLKPHIKENFNIKEKKHMVGNLYNDEWEVHEVRIESKISGVEGEEKERQLQNILKDAGVFTEFVESTVDKLKNITDKIKNL